MNLGGGSALSLMRNRSRYFSSKSMRRWAPLFEIPCSLAFLIMRLKALPIDSLESSLIDAKSDSGYVMGSSSAS